MAQQNPKRGKISEKQRSKLRMRCGHGDCKYASTMAGGMCDYLDMTGKLRGCPPEGCDKYEKAKRGR